MEAMQAMSGASPSRGLVLPRGKYSSEQQQAFADDAKRDGYVILRNHYPQDTLKKWAEEFQILSDTTAKGDRGKGRYYITLPFDGIWADPTIFEDPDILAIVQHLVGEDPVLCQLATDTPILGSEYQEIHRDTPPLFPELSHETPAFQLAVNFPLCDCTVEPWNGPVEIAKGTHMYTKEEGQAKIKAGEVKLEPMEMKLGDVMVRDVRGLHRGTPNRTNIPRPMVVIGYSRKWLFRPEVQIEVPKSLLPDLSNNAKWLLRFNPIVDKLTPGGSERYQSFLF